jgi:hypothetical protein
MKRETTGLNTIKAQAYHHGWLSTHQHFYIYTSTPPMMRFINGLPHQPLPYLSVGHVFQVLNAAIFDIEQPEAPAGFKMEHYQVDYATGFFPQEPLPRLSGQFEIWENTLQDAEGKLSLGEDTRETAKAKRPYGETWRERVRNVSMITTELY